MRGRTSVACGPCRQNPEREKMPVSNPQRRCGHPRASDPWGRHSTLSALYIYGVYDVYIYTCTCLIWFTTLIQKTMYAKQCTLTFAFGAFGSVKRTRNICCSFVVRYRLPVVRTAQLVHVWCSMHVLRAFHAGRAYFFRELAVHPFCRQFWPQKSSKLNFGDRKKFSVGRLGIPYMYCHGAY